MNELMSKQGRSVRHLAQVLLRSRSGERLPAMQQLAQEQDASVGTVQAAMQYLLTEAIVEVENRGRLGSFVQRLDYPRLWGLAEQRTMSAILPMPYSRHLEGLATGLREGFDGAQMDLAMRFLRGSTARIERLHSQQCDWVVTSRYAAEAAWAHGFSVELVLSFGPGTYTIDHVLLLNGAQELKADMRVGIDTRSADHAFVVRQLCQGTPVRMVDIDYSKGLDQLLRGDIDATVWTGQGLPILPENIHIQHMRGDILEGRQLASLGEAVLLTLPEARHIRHVLEAVLDHEQVATAQRDVIEGRRLAAY